MTYLFIHCTEFNICRQTVFQNIRNTVERTLAQSETELTQIFLYGHCSYNLSINRLIIKEFTIWKSFHARWTLVKKEKKKRNKVLTHFMSLTLSIPTENIRKPGFFYYFQVGIEKYQWRKMGWKIEIVDQK